MFRKYSLALNTKQKEMSKNIKKEGITTNMKEIQKIHEKAI